MAKPTDDAGSAVMEAPKTETKTENKPAVVAVKPAGAAAPMSVPIYRLPVADFRPSPTNPRKSFDEVKLREVGETMKIQQLHAVVARRIAGKPGVELIAGESRWRAAKLVGLTHLDVKIVEASDVQVRELQLIENIQRKDVTPLEEARAMKGLMDCAKYDVAQIAAKLKLEPRTVYNRLELLKMPAFLLKSLESGALTAAHAALIAKLPKEADQKKALKAALPEFHSRGMNKQIKAQMSIRDLEHWIAAEIYHDLAAAPFKIDDTKLCPAAGACAVCPKRTAAQPLAFPDSRADCCLDTSCYEEKRKAHIEQRIKAGAIAICDEYYSYRPGILGKDRWKESKSPKAVSAVFVSGDSMGREITVDVRKSNDDEDASSSGKSAKKPGEKKVAPLSERRKVLATRRLGWIQTELQNNRVPKTDFETIQKVHGDKWAQHVFALVAIFGTSHRCEGGNNYCSDKGSWTAQSSIAPDKSLEAAGEKLWNSTRKVVAMRLVFRTLSDLDLDEAKNAASFIGVKWSELEAAAAAALPEPKSWASAARPAPAAKTPDKISGKEIAAKIKAARAGKTPKAKAKK